MKPLNEDVNSLQLILKRKDYHRKFTYKPILEDLNGVFSVGDRESVECVDFSSSDMQTIMKYNFFLAMTMVPLQEPDRGSDGAYLNPIRKYWLKKDKIRQMRNQAIKDVKNASINIAFESTEKMLLNSIDKSKLDRVFNQSLEETKLALQKKSS